MPALGCALSLPPVNPASGSASLDMPEPVATEVEVVPTVEVQPSLEPPTPDPSQWQTYVNQRLGYSISYPTDCYVGPLPPSCKQQPPDQAPESCRCFFNAQDPMHVVLQAYRGEVGPDTSPLFLTISQQDSEAFNPPAEEDLAGWVADQFSFLQAEFPQEINFEVGGQPALRLELAPSAQAYGSTEVFLRLDQGLLRISAGNALPEANQQLFEQMLASFRVVD
jgi:hypothetical protein